jgi:hypothetical protein
MQPSSINPRQGPVRPLAPPKRLPGVKVPGVKAWPFPVTPRRALTEDVVACARRIIETTAHHFFGA